MKAEDKESVISNEEKKCVKNNSEKKYFYTLETDLLPFKLFYFSFYGALGAVFPFMSLYLKQLGLSPREIGILAGVRPILGFCSGPLWGSFADRWRMRRCLLVVSTLGWVAFIMGIGFVTPPRKSEEKCRDVGLNISEPDNASVPFDLNVTMNEGLRINRAELLESRGWMFNTDDLQRVFYIVFVLVIFGELVQSPTSSLADSGCLEHLGSENMNKYGFQRSWGSLGFGALSISAGGVVALNRYKFEICGFSFQMSDYRICFYFFAGCMVFTFIAALMYKFPKQEEEKSNGKPIPAVMGTFKLFCSIHYASWLFVAFFMGVSNGLIWGFLYWHLENIGATQLLVGIGSVVSCTSEALMFLVVFYIFKHISYSTFMVLGLLGYICRFCVFASVTNPWLVLPVEIFQGCTYAGVWSAMTAYMCSAVPQENLATMQGILHGVYWGLGSGCGSLIGGILVQRLGAPMTFWIFAGASGFHLVFFVIAQKFTKGRPLAEEYEEIVSYTPQKQNGEIDYDKLSYH
ncbi:major facilitator superfamily domain-containing protein 6-like [Saccostrea cucullata]|uniref:major facilitator superfamily domain-containing protein 6-like n=1 Tax=Saccostrea cuccullata TaxID=36930 RepID=UPI002ED2F19C